MLSKIFHKTNGWGFKALELQNITLCRVEMDFWIDAKMLLSFDSHVFQYNPQKLIEYNGANDCPSITIVSFVNRSVCSEVVSNEKAHYDNVITWRQSPNLFKRSSLPQIDFNLIPMRFQTSALTEGSLRWRRRSLTEMSETLHWIYNNIIYKMFESIDVLQILSLFPNFVIQIKSF